MERVQEPGSDWGEIMASVRDWTTAPGTHSRCGCLHKIKPINNPVLVEGGAYGSSHPTEKLLAVNGGSGKVSLL